MKILRATLFAASALAVLVVVVFAGEPRQAQAQQQSFEVVASGLDNPRGLDLGPAGALNVAEAGKGGQGPCFDGPEGEVCYGETGALTRVWKGQQTRVVTGLPSLAGQDGAAAIGPHDVSLLGRKAYVAVGLGSDPADRKELVRQGARGAKNLGRLLSTTPSGKWRSVADIAAYEARFNPDGAEEDSNPYSLLARPGGRVVVDAGANALLRVRPNGKISTLATFPERMVDAPPFLGLPPGAQIPMQSVPDTVTVGPDGAYYVGELTGFPFPVGAARVYRVGPWGGEPEIFAEGFTNIIDIGFGRDGGLYVLEHDKNGLLAPGDTGALIRVDPYSGRNTTIASRGLVAPTGLALDRRGAIYVSNYGVSAEIGQVVRIDREGEIP